MRKLISKPKVVMKTTTNNKEYKAAHKAFCNNDYCLICAPDEGENKRKRIPKHGVKKPKYKDKR